MGLDMRLELKLGQQLVMTPQLQQAIKLLQLSRMDLIDAVREELMENPMLEESSEIDAHAARLDTVQEMRDQDQKDRTPDVEVDGSQLSEQAANQIDWEAYFQNYSTPTPGTGTQRLRDDDLPGYEATLTKETTLHDHLIWQLQVSEFSEQEKRVASTLVFNLDDDGYLKDVTCAQIAEELDQDEEYVEEVLEIIQDTFDPIGVGARDLKECLLIQARFHELGSIVEDIIAKHLPNLEKKNIPAIARALEIDEDEIIEAAKLIASLEPRPGRPYINERPRYITPDIYIRRVDGEYKAVLNEDGMPRLRISAFYRQALSSGGNSDTKKYVTEKLNSAQWLIRSIQQRQKTIVKVTESIIRFQRDFLEKGVEHLKPLILRNVAEDIGMHESTVSRVTNNKYVHTPQGIFELKYFFNSTITGVGSQGDLASEAVKKKIKDLVSQEDGDDPYSDQKIVELLRKDGVKIARRTVAKYREAMGVLPSSKRRRLF
ncbi:MAG: RNA polymerase factor sigma-54 [Myxococcales bacterium]|nr:RNA polymerase factor sigma-54 [Myxococcales bacterium]MCB9548633.1 RNA polymerase factor sigma-54 [Myxococcales bacterium]